MCPNTRGPSACRCNVSRFRHFCAIASSSHWRVQLVYKSVRSGSSSICSEVNADARKCWILFKCLQLIKTSLATYTYQAHNLLVNVAPAPLATLLAFKKKIIYGENSEKKENVAAFRFWSSSNLCLPVPFRCECTERFLDKRLIAIR